MSGKATILKRLKWRTALTAQSVPGVCRVMILDNQPVFRKGLGQLLESSGKVTLCREFSPEAVQTHTIAQDQPQVVILGIDQHSATWGEQLAGVRGTFPQAGLLVVVEKADSRTAERVLKAGALGLIARDKGAEEFLQAVGAVQANEVYLEKALAMKLLERAFLPTPVFSAGVRRPDRASSSPDTTAALDFTGPFQNHNFPETRA